MILEKVPKLISQFMAEGLEVIEQDDPFESNKKYVQRELDRLESGESKSYTLEQLNEVLEKTINKHEN